MVLIVLAAATDSSGLYLAGSILGGAGFGAAFLGGLRALVAAIPPEHRASVMSAFYVAAYASLSMPAVLAGVVVTHISLQSTFEIFGSAVAAIALLVALEAWRTRPNRHTNETPEPTTPRRIPTTTGLTVADNAKTGRLEHCEPSPRCWSSAALRPVTIRTRTMPMRRRRALHPLRRRLQIVTVPIPEHKGVVINAAPQEPGPAARPPEPRKIQRSPGAPEPPPPSPPAAPSPSPILRPSSILTPRRARSLSVLSADGRSPAPRHSALTAARLTRSPGQRAERPRRGKAPRRPPRPDNPAAPCVPCKDERLQPPARARRVTAPPTVMPSCGHSSQTASPPRKASFVQSTPGSTKPNASPGSANQQHRPPAGDFRARSAIRVTAYPCSDGNP